MDCVPSLELRVKPYALTWRASLSICLAVLLINLGTQFWSYGSLQNLNFLWAVLLLLLIQALTSQFGWTGRPMLVFAAPQLQLQDGDSIVWHLDYQRIDQLSRLDSFWTGPLYLILTKDGDSYGLPQRLDPEQLPEIEQRLVQHLTSLKTDSSLNHG